MRFEAYIYVICTLLSTFAISGINFNNFFQKNKNIQARIFVILIILGLSYISSSFIIEFIKYSKII